MSDAISPETEVLIKRTKIIIDTMVALLYILCVLFYAYYMGTTQSKFELDLGDQDFS